MRRAADDPAGVLPLLGSPSACSSSHRPLRPGSDDCHGVIWDRLNALQRAWLEQQVPEVRRPRSDATTTLPRGRDFARNGRAGLGWFCTVATPC